MIKFKNRCYDSRNVKRIGYYSLLCNGDYIRQYPKIRDIASV